MGELDYHGDKLTEVVIPCVIQVHKKLGPGFLEGIYRKALVMELRSHGLRVETEREVVIPYERQGVGRHRLDIVVPGERIVELKTAGDLSRLTTHKSARI